VTPSLPIGTIVIYNGYAYRFCGITPASIQPTMAVLEDPRTGARSDVPVVQLDHSTPSGQGNTC
jgi:hypothetical protein